MHELAQARETVAKLAANEERLRLARDMHDLTGQSLSMITLKSELAAKRLTRLPAWPRTRHGARRPRRHRPGQPADAARHQGGGQRLPPPHARDRGHHRAERARAAGIRLDDDPGLTLRSGTFDADAEAALAWCLREAVTNVIRHSGAKNCRIRLTEHPGELSLEVSDDGRGLDQPSRTPEMRREPACAACPSACPP